MRFSKSNDSDKVIRTTGSRDNILGISFANQQKIKNNPEVIEWTFPNIDNSKIRTSNIEVLNQVFSGLNSINQDLETSYKVSKIEYVPAEAV